MKKIDQKILLTCSFGVMSRTVLELFQIDEVEQREVEVEWRMHNSRALFNIFYCCGIYWKMIQKIMLSKITILFNAIQPFYEHFSLSSIVDFQSWWMFCLSTRLIKIQVHASVWDRKRGNTFVRLNSLPCFALMPCRNRLLSFVREMRENNSIIVCWRRDREIEKSKLKRRKKSFFILAWLRNRSSRVKLQSNCISRHVLDVSPLTVNHRVYVASCWMLQKI